MSQSVGGLEARFTSVAAQLFVRDMGRSIGFFGGMLGFGVDFVYGDPAFYAQVRRDEARLALRLIEVPAVCAVDVREREQLLSASITLGRSGEIEELFGSYRGCRGHDASAFKSEALGSADVRCAGPDGNLILFAAPVG